MVVFSDFCSFISHFIPNNQNLFQSIDKFSRWLQKSSTKDKFFIECFAIKKAFWSYMIEFLLFSLEIWTKFVFQSIFFFYAYRQ